MVHVGIQFAARCHRNRMNAMAAIWSGLTARGSDRRWARSRSGRRCGRVGDDRPALWGLLFGQFASFSSHTQPAHLSPVLARGCNAGGSASFGGLIRPQPEEWSSPYRIAATRPRDADHGSADPRRSLQAVIAASISSVSSCIFHAGPASLRFIHASAADRRSKNAEAEAFLPSRIIRTCGVYTALPLFRRRSVMVPTIC